MGNANTRGISVGGFTAAEHKQMLTEIGNDVTKQTIEIQIYIDKSKH